MNKSDYYNQKIRKDEFEKLIKSVSSNTPFLLFPLRIETHFRKSPNNGEVKEENSVLEILKAFNVIIDKIIAKDFDIISDLASLKKKVENADLVEQDDIRQLSDLSNTFIELIPRLLSLDKYEKPLQYCIEIRAAINKMKKSSNNSYSKATCFLKRLKKCVNYIHSLSDIDKLPYRSKVYFVAEEHKNDYNKKLYAYITNTLAKTDKFLTLSVEMLNSLPAITKTQKEALNNTLLKGLIYNTDKDLNEISKTLKLVYSENTFQDNHITAKYNEDWNSSVNKVRAKWQKLQQTYLALNFSKIKEKSEKFTKAAVLIMDCTLRCVLSPIPPAWWNRLVNKVNLSLYNCIYVSQDEYDFVKILASKLQKYKYRVTANIDVIFNIKNVTPYSQSSKAIKRNKELCVRIFPDDIFLDYLTEGLTEQEVADGKQFWIQWYIASGNDVREYEAWQVLCNKYEINRAAWIARSLKPTDLDRFRKEGDLFYRRPYCDQIVENENNTDGKTINEPVKIENEILMIYKNLNEITLAEVDTIYAKTGEWRNEYEIRTYLKRVQWNMYRISRSIVTCEFVVDYLYDNISTAIDYLERRLDSYIAFYNKFPGEFANNIRKMEVWDTDYTILLSFRKEVSEFKEKLNSKYISLEDMINKYLDNPLHNFFSGVSVTINKSNKYDLPVSRILPERFVFIGEVSKTKKQIIRYGNRVKQNLQLGFDPNEDLDTEPYKINENGELEVKSGMDWMIDYSVAEQAGMAITIPLNDSVTAFNYIYILGIKDGSKNDKEYLQELFNSHNYSSSGLEMLKFGTPTNLLDDINIEGRNVYDTDYEKQMRFRYDIEVNEIYKNFENETDSYRMSQLLGMDFNDCWAFANNADNEELNKAEIVNSIMWDYFLPELKSDGTFSKNGKAPNDAGETYSQNSNVQTFLRGLPKFIKYYCKGRGMFPPFKIGDQPYGIFPVTNFTKFRPLSAIHPNSSQIDYKENKFLVQLKNLLVLLSDRWKVLRKNHVISSKSLNTNISNSNDNAQTRYLKMAGLLPHSATFYEREMVDAHHLLPQEVRTQVLVQSSYAKEIAHVFDWISANGISYDAFLEATHLFDALPIDDFVTQISLDEEGDVPCPLWLLDIKNKIRNQLPDVENNDCNLLISEFFDLFTYRIDAWFSAILNYTLYKFGKLNGKTQNKSFAVNVPKIGAYGWVFDLKENKRTEIDNKQAIAQKMNLSNTSSPIFKTAEGSEYIVAPSIQHAITAAVLRSSYLNSKSNPSDTRMCINLTSMRARQALRMIDGVKAGMSTGLILGADLERYLHEAYKQFNVEMDKFIYPLRKLFPQTIDIEAEDARANTYSMQVINGEALLNTFKDKWNYNGSIYDYLKNNYILNYELDWANNLFGSQTNESDCFFKLVERMADTYDALSDLLLSEGVYRLVQGNRSAFSSIVNFLSKGSGNLPEPAILTTPMEHVVSEYKVGIALPECTTVIKKPMCIAEPSVNKWLEELLGKLSTIYFIVKLNTANKVGGETDSVYRKHYLEDFNINPIEYLYLSSNKTFFASYLSMLFRLENNNFSDEITILFNPSDVLLESGICEYQLNKDDLSIFEDEIRIDAINELLMQSHAMKTDDWVAQVNSDTDNEKAVDSSDLKRRYEGLMNYVKNLSLKMASASLNLDIDYCTDDVLIALCKLLKYCTEAGLPNALSGFKPGMFADKIDKVYNRLQWDNAVEMQKSFIQHFKSIQSAIEKKIEKAEALIQHQSPDTFESQRYINAIQEILSESFKIYPRFSLHAATDKNQRDNYKVILTNGIANYSNLNEIDFEEWISDVAEVRQGMKSWNHILMFENMLGVNTGKPAIIQFDGSGDASLSEWLGCEVSDESVLNDVDSLVIFNSNAVQITQNKSSVAGIMFDAWLEYIPYMKQTAGMVFHCDQPDTEAPQSLLYAISPDFKSAGQKTWSLDGILDILGQTRFMAMNRAVEPDHIYSDPILSILLPLLSKSK